MSEILLFHHAQGLTPGVIAFADRLREAGHTVHTPDLYEGATFETVEEGVEHAGSIGFETVLDRGVASAEALPEDLVYAGFSLGVMPAQKLAQTRPGARAALFVSSCLPIAEFGGEWPESVPVQIVATDADPYFVDEGDIDSARELVAYAHEARMDLYPGTAHLFADSSLSSYEPGAAAFLEERALHFLAHHG